VDNKLLKILKEQIEKIEKLIDPSLPNFGVRARK